MHTVIKEINSHPKLSHWQRKCVLAAASLVLYQESGSLGLTPGEGSLAERRALSGAAV